MVEFTPNELAKERGGEMILELLSSDMTFEVILADEENLEGKDILAARDSSTHPGREKR